MPPPLSNERVFETLLSYIAAKILYWRIWKMRADYLGLGGNALADGSRLKKMKKSFEDSLALNSLEN